MKRVFKPLFVTLTVALLITLQASAPARADEKIDEKTRIINSLLVPLSPDEMRQLDDLVKASEPYDTAAAESNAAFEAVIK